MLVATVMSRFLWLPDFAWRLMDAVSPAALNQASALSVLGHQSTPSDLNGWFQVLEDVISEENLLLIPPDPHSDQQWDFGLCFLLQLRLAGRFEAALKYDKIISVRFCSLDMSVYIMPLDCVCLLLGLNTADFGS